ncbi:MAG TPA: ABC transporter permease [Burkholderiaceae bacterium]|nr:ABC transporter permease [Burkholderiaceae bacterium]
MSAVLVWMRQLAAMTAKELKQLWRDRALFGFTVYVFTLNIVIAAGGTSFELQHVPVIVNDDDHSAASRDLIYRFQPPYFALQGGAGDPRAAMHKLDREDARVLIDVPSGFAETLREGARPGIVLMLVDASHANSGYLAASYGVSIAAGFGAEWTAQNLARAGIEPDRVPRIENRIRLWHNADLNEHWYNTISELLTMMTVMCILLPAAALVREKERGTIEQLLVSPLSPLQVMLAKVAAMIAVVLVGVSVALFGIMQPVYDVPVKGSLVLLFTLTALYAFTNAGLGLATATFARNSGQVGLLVLLIVMPIITLSGTWTPLESMPAWLRAAMTLSPLRHFVDIVYSILLRGAGMDVLWDSVLAMAVLGAALFGVGLARFRRQFG